MKTAYYDDLTSLPYYFLKAYLAIYIELELSKSLHSLEDIKRIVSRCNYFVTQITYIKCSVAKSAIIKIVAARNY